CVGRVSNLPLSPAGWKPAPRRVSVMRGAGFQPAIVAGRLETCPTKDFLFARPGAGRNAPLAVAAPVFPTARRCAMASDVTDPRSRDRRVDEVLAAYLEAAQANQAPDRRE